jgi:hypothetical protein
MCPTLSGFIAWAESAMGITPETLPTTSIYWTWAFNQAIEIVDPTWCCVSPTTYLIMVYNLAGSNLINYVQDPGDAPIYKNDQTYFEYFRDKWNILGPVSGVVSGASDQSTSTTLEVPQSLKDLTLMDLQHLKDPFGRTYLMYAQEQGSLWGLS